MKGYPTGVVLIVAFQFFAAIATTVSFSKSQVSFGIIGLFSVALPLVAAFGLLKKQNWARLFVMGLSGLSAVLCLVAAVSLFRIDGPRLVVFSFSFLIFLGGMLQLAVFLYLKRAPVKEFFCKK